MHIDRDLRMVGYVIYVGNSSLSVNIDLYEKQNKEWVDNGHANFVLQINNKDETK